VRLFGFVKLLVAAAALGDKLGPVGLETETNRHRFVGF
jgi:hypothetical protein